MNDWIKLVLPLLAVSMTTIIGFFLTDHIGELRSGRTIVYSVDDGPDMITLNLSNVSRLAVDDAQFFLRCTNTDGASSDGGAACFAGSPNSAPYEVSSSGPVAVRQITPLPGNNLEQVGIRITLLPDARISLAVPRNGDVRGNVIFRYDPTAVTPQPLRIIRAGGITGYVVLNYVQVLVWAFATALTLAALAGLLGILSLALAGLRGVSRFRGFRWLRSFLEWLVPTDPCETLKWR
jgi:hypothetical protein